MSERSLPNVANLLRLCADLEAERDRLKARLQTVKDLQESEIRLCCELADKSAALADLQRANAEAQLSKAQILLRHALQQLPEQDGWSSTWVRSVRRFLNPPPPEAEQEPKP